MGESRFANCKLTSWVTLHSCVQFFGEYNNFIKYRVKKGVVHNGTPEWCRLRAHNCQKSRFLTCSCHIIYKTEAVGWSFPIILLELLFLWVFEIWGNFVKNWYFVNNCLLEFEFSNPFVRMCTCDCNYQPHTTFRFYLIDFQLLTYEVLVSKTSYIHSRHVTHLHYWLPFANKIVQV